MLVYALGQKAWIAFLLPLSGSSQISRFCSADWVYPLIQVAVAPVQMPEVLSQVVVAPVQMQEVLGNCLRLIHPPLLAPQNLLQILPPYKKSSAPKVS